MSSSTTDKVKGMANEAAGNVKQGVGKAVGSEKMQAEGIAQETKGEAQQAVGKTKDAVKDTADRLRDSAHRNL
ncbi:MAG: CsbD family protein [Bosea sp.]|nr:CsbD family protein [Bosea sp. (in: a-proteobacteria)]